VDRSDLCFLFSLMVVMALITTAMTGVLLRLVYPEQRVRQDQAALDADAAQVGEPSPSP
jgi:hypothetical protein